MTVVLISIFPIFSRCLVIKTAFLIVGYCVHIYIPMSSQDSRLGCKDFRGARLWSGVAQRFIERVIDRCGDQKLMKRQQDTGMTICMYIYIYICIYIHILIVLYFVQILICLKPPILMNIGRISGELRWIWGRIILERKFRRDQENFEGGTSKMAWNTCPHLCQSLESLIHQTWFIFAHRSPSWCFARLRFAIFCHHLPGLVKSLGPQSVGTQVDAASRSIPKLREGPEEHLEDGEIVFQ